MRLRAKHRFVKITSLELYISLVKNYTRFTIDSNLGRFSGIVEDPVDFVAEMAKLTGSHKFGQASFKDAIVIITTEAMSVTRDYLMDMERAKKWSYRATDEICIYTEQYNNMLSDVDVHLPVCQHCVSFFHLYLNAIRYLYTAAKIPAEK